MREMIKKIVMELLPELTGGLHLDRYARVLAVADAPTEGATSERFRPRYAVDLEILGPDMEPDASFPRYSAVPLPVSVGGGQESGTFCFPEEGALVVVGFAYGRQDHPIIRQIFPLGVSLPALERGEVLMQQSPTSFQRVDAQGNWQRETTADIHENSLGRTVKAENYNADLGNESRSVAAHSTESVGSCKTIEAGTVLTLLAGLRADLGSLGALNLTAGGDSTHSTAGSAQETVGKDHTSKVTGNRQIGIAGNRSLTVQGADSVTVQGTETIKATDKLIIESAQEILLRAPVVKIQGILTTEGYEGGPGSSTLYGDFTVRQGGVAVPDADVSAGSVSLRGHTHKGVQSGSSTTGTPVGG